MELDKKHLHKDNKKRITPLLYLQSDPVTASGTEKQDIYDNISFVGDWKIIFSTLITVLKREGISSETSATMEEFHGSI